MPYIGPVMANDDTHEDRAGGKTDGKRPRHQPSFWARRLTDVYTVGAGGVARVGAWWWKRSERWSEESIRERWTEELPPNPPPRPIWIHAASMGEVRVGGYFAEAVTARGHNIVVSAMTETGYQLCGEVYPPGTTRFRVPFDLPDPMRRAFDHLNPRALVLIETEWWPNFLTVAASRDVPVFIVNGRLSEKAFRRYRMGSAYWRSILRPVRFFFMRTQEEAERVLALGVDPWRVRAAGSLKVPTIGRRADRWEAVMEGVGIETRPVWIAGCVRPGEESAILEAYRVLRTEFPDLQLWMAPRHPDRFDKVARIVRRSGFETARWSELEPAGITPPRGAVLLIDKMGILARLYPRAAVAFVGGSLRPYGGHNPLEPALAGAPVVFGPHMEQQRDAAELLIGLGTATEVSDAASLRAAVAARLRSPEAVETRRRRARDLRERLIGIRDEVVDDLFAVLDALEGRASDAECPVADEQGTGD
ncbi:MAG TPA: glycosyltransferase N-terminal domain-containing protein [Acidobacteriota bacterium]|nr:glycosyltransferase N-terminal domain-containing protein [Acidobacteriota bacterium]